MKRIMRIFIMTMKTTTVNSYILVTKGDFKEHRDFKESKVFIPFEIDGHFFKKGDTIIFRKGAIPTYITALDGTECLRLEKLSVMLILK